MVPFLLVSLAGLYYFRYSELGEIKRRVREATEEPLVDFAYTVAALLSSDASSELVIPEGWDAVFSKLYQQRISANIYALNKDRVDLQVIVTDDKGIVRFDSKGKDTGKDFSQWNDILKARQGAYGARSTDDNEMGCSVMHVSAPIRSADKIVGTLTVAKPNCNANTFIRRTVEEIASSTLLIALSVLIGSVGILFWATRPVKKLIQYASAVRDGEKVELPTLPRNELGSLGRAIEDMKESLEGKKYIQQFVQTVSHELRSPISGIRASAEILGEVTSTEDRTKFVDNILAESIRLDSLVGKLLTITTLRQGKDNDYAEAVDLRELTSDILHDLRSAIERKNLKVNFSPDQRLVVKGNAFWLREAILNVLQNAIEFSPDDSAISISTSISGDLICIIVDDEGPGIPPWALSKVFDSFFSLSRPGSKKRSSGLGLSLTKEIIEKIGGSIELSNRVERGTSVKITLPSY